MEIRTLDLSDGSALTSAYHVEWAANEAARPGWVGIGAEARILGWRADDGWTNHLLGAWDHGTLLGVGARLTAEDTPDTGWIFSWVHPQHQGHGVGTELVRAAERNSPAKTTRFVSRAYRPTIEGILALEDRFAGPLGYSVATTETVLELDLQASKLVNVAATSGYAISTHVNGVPERFREQVGKIKGLVDAEAPNGELGWRESTVSPAAYLNEIAIWNAQGSTVIESIAVDLHGAVAAWTCLVTSNTKTGPASVEGTLVLAEHRGHGLGVAVKSASLTRALAIGSVRRVRTSSDDQNIWMHAINSSLGFKPVETEVIFQKLVTAAD